MSDNKEKKPEHVELVEVIALEAGHDGRVFRAANEKFHVSKDRLENGGDTWFVEVDKAPEPKAKPTDKRPPGAGPLKGSQEKV